MDRVVIIMNRQDSSNSVVGGVGFDNESGARSKVSEDRSGGKGLLERFKSGLAGGVKVPWDVLSGESCKRSDYTGVVVNETSIEITKTQEGLNILHFSGFRPIQ